MYCQVGSEDWAELDTESALNLLTAVFQSLAESEIQEYTACHVLAHSFHAFRPCLFTLCQTPHSLPTVMQLL